MILPILFAAAAAAQPAASGVTPETVEQRLGRPFMSPMGEPVFGRTPNEEGLTAWFAQVDGNHDGSLTVEEMQADAERFFQTLDTNHDGEIDPDEIDHYEHVIAPQVHSRALAIPTSSPGAQTGAGGRRGGRGRHGGGGFGGFGSGDDEAGAGRFGLLQIPEPVASADADFNRGVSVQEFKAAAAKRFQLLDVDHKGRLTLAELEGVRHAASSAADHPVSKPNPEQTGKLDPLGDTDSPM
jgi:Ca2+-binding EF-hand superfamily protein